MNKQAINAALFALCLSATQITISHAQGPVQQPIDGGPAPTTPATETTPANPNAGTIATVVERNADQYSDDEVKRLGQGPAFPYTLLESALSVAVNEKGAVNYNKLQLNQDLALFVRAVGLADLKQFPVFKYKDDDGREITDNRSELTFWINAYNGLFLKAVATGYPVKQISQIKDLQTAKTRIVGGNAYTFPELREKIVALDARAIFALVDGTVYGPRAPRAAYRYVGLGAQLNSSITNFVNDPIRVPVPDRIGKSITVSPWLQTIDPYFKKGADKGKWLGLRNVLTAYSTTSSLKNYYGSGDYDVRFFPANDTINDHLNAF
jgi:hypothetical protein